MALSLCSVSWATEDGDTEGTTATKPAVAKVGDQEYATLAQAINAEGAEKVITLIAETNEDVTIPAGKKVTLNLNVFGCTGEEMVQEMKPYFVDFPNVKNNCLRFEVSPSVEESAGMTDADWAKLGNDFMQRMGLMNHQYIIVKHSGTEKNRRQAHLHILANRVSLSGELYKDNWIGKRATEAANSIARERNLVQSKDIGKANREEIKQAMDGVLARMQGFDLAGFSRELGKLGFKVREARASTGKLNGYYVEARSGTEYKASEIGKDYTLAHIEKTQKKLKYNSISRNYGNTLKPKDGGLHL